MDASGNCIFTPNITSKSTVYVRSYDWAGNVSSSISTIMYVDQAAPVINTMSLSGGLTGSASSSYKFFDTNSITFSTSYREENYSSYTVTAAGNSTICSLSSGSLGNTTTNRSISFTCNMTSISKSFTSLKTITLTMYDLAGNSTSKSVSFYLIDQSRKIVINSFSIKGYGSFANNYISSIFNSKGKMAPIYSVSNSTYLDMNKGALTIGDPTYPGDNFLNSCMVASGTYVTTEHSCAFSPAEYRWWYENHSNGEQGTAQLILYNTYGQKTYATATVYFDYTAPSVTSFTLSGSGAKVSGWAKSATLIPSITTNATDVYKYVIQDLYNSKTYLNSTSQSTFTGDTSVTSYYLTVYDKAGNDSIETSASVTFDTTLPTLNRLYVYGNTGDDGYIYFADTNISLSLNWYEANYHSFTGNVSGTTVTCTGSLSASTTSKSTSISCNMSNISVSYSTLRSMNIVVYDKAGNSRTISGSFYRIDYSRQLEFDRANISAKGSNSYDYIGPKSITGGSIAGLYELYDDTYLSTRNGLLEIGSLGQSDNFVNRFFTSGEYFTIEDPSSASGATIDEWYADHADGSREIANIALWNIYGQPTYYQFPIVFDYTAPKISSSSISFQDHSIGDNGSVYVAGNSAVLTVKWYEANYFGYNFYLPSNATKSITSGSMKSSTTAITTQFTVNLTNVVANFDNSVSISIKIYDSAGNSSTAMSTFYRIDKSRDIGINNFAVLGYHANADNVIGPMSLTSGNIAPKFSLTNTTYLNKNYLSLEIGNEEGDRFQPNTWIDCYSCTNITSIITSGGWLTADNDYAYDERTTVEDWYSQFEDGDERVATIQFKNIYGRYSSATAYFEFDFQNPVVDELYLHHTYMDESLTIGSNGEYYVTGGSTIAQIKYTERNPNDVMTSLNRKKVSHSTSNKRQVSTGVWSETLTNDISVYSVDFETSITLLVTLHDLAGNSGSKSIKFYKIDDSRDINITSFNITANGASLANIIGPRSVSGGKMLATYTLASDTYFDKNRSDLVIGSDRQEDAFICNGTILGVPLTIQNSMSCAGTTVDEWYAAHPHGSEAIAQMMAVNIYGRKSYRTVNIKFDYVSPKMSLYLNTVTKTAYPAVSDEFTSVNRQYLGSHYKYYMSTNPNLLKEKTVSTIPWLTLDAANYGTKQSMNLSGGSYYVYVYAIDTSDSASADLYTKDAAGNLLSNASNASLKVSDDQVIYRFTVNVPVNKQDDNSTSLEEDDINTGITSNPSIVGLKVFAIDRMLIVTFDSAQTANSYSLAQINNAISHTGYRIVSVQDSTTYVFDKSYVFEKVLVGLTGTNSSKNELMDLIIVINSPQVVGDTATGATTFTQGDEIGNLGVSFTSTEAFDVQTQITLDGVLVKEVNTNRTGTYEIKTIAKDASGRVTRVSKTVVVEPKAEETKTTTSVQEVKTQELADSITSQTSEVKVENTQSTNRVENNSYKVVAIVETKTTSKKKEEEEEIED